MDEIQKQILLNQISIMKAITNLGIPNRIESDLKQRILETEETIKFN